MLETCSSVSAAVYGATLTTEMLLGSDQVLTRPAAPVHVTHDSPADLSAERVKTSHRECLVLFDTHHRLASSFMAGIFCDNSTSLFDLHLF